MPEEPRGFALIVTLMLMILLSLLALGMLSLSSVSMRTAGQGSAHAEARANARLALMMAIGQLQKHAGDDRRISRAADQIPSDATTGNGTAAVKGRRFWTGIYDAWDDGEISRPQPNLRTWLVSGSGAANVDAPTQTTAPEEMVQLVGSGSAGDLEEDWVEAPKVDVKKEGLLSGKLAWWTGDRLAAGILFRLRQGCATGAFP